MTHQRVQIGPSKLSRLNKLRKPSAMNKLPNDVIKNIRGYGSDVYEPTPTAELIKTLRFDHKDTSEDNGLYLPHRLEVTATDGHFNCFNVTAISPIGVAVPIPKRNYYISDLLPSYWSDYADTMDRGCWNYRAGDDDDAYDLMRRLQAES